MATQTRGTAPEKSAKPGRPAQPGRANPALFVRQVMGELRKVIWPTRKELGTYTAVALVFILIMTGIVVGLDFGFTKLIFYVFG